MNFEVGPALMKAIMGLGRGDVERVLVNAIDLRERFDQVEGVAFVTSELRPHRMSIDCDPQSVSPVSLLCLESTSAEEIYLLFAAAACVSSFC